MELSTLYLALTEYRKITAENRTLEKQRKGIYAADAENDKIEIVKTNCIIEEDWIEAIEKGLVHIEKAIAEERQFIRSNGEVVPIEKVKHVSKDSVEHLARHSSLITKKPEGEDIIPDSLYTVERLSDYAVYENRFLYMLLCYLRDFITFRYDKILELTNTYDGKLKILKRVNLGSSKTLYEINLSEEIRNDPYLKEHNPAKDKIDRIDLILKTVIIFLNTPLMEFVAKSPMLKPPITETNVLRMNKNFKGAKELYYFISSYQGAGYKIERTTRTISPFPEETGDEFAEVLTLLSFLTYEHGLGLEKELKAEYEKRQQELKELEKQKHAEQLKSLKKRVKQSGESIEEYALMLEQRNKTLEADSLQLASAKEQLKKNGEEISALRKSVEELGGTVDTQRRELDGIAEVHRAALEAKEREHAEEVEKLNAEHGEATAELERKHSENLSANAEKYNAELNRVVGEYNEKLSAQREECEALILEAREERDAQIKEHGETKELLERMAEEKLLVEARLNAALHAQGAEPETDYSAEENFAEIEKQYKAFKAFFRGEWKSAKKKIRKEILTSENIRKISEGKYEYGASEEIDFDPALGRKKKSPKQKPEGERHEKAPKTVEPPENILAEKTERTEE